MTAPDEDGAARPALFVRIAVVFASVTAIWMLLSSGVSAILGDDYSRGAHVVRAIGATVLTVPLIIVARRQFDRRPWSGLQLSSLRDGWRPLLFGIGCWVVPAAVGAAIVLGAGWAEITVEADTARVLAGIAMLAVLVLLYEALPEELIFRGYFFANLEERYSRRVTIVAQAALFTLWGTLIGAAASLDRIVFFFLFSCVLGMLRAFAGTVWATIGFHWAFQVTAQFAGDSWDEVTLHDPDDIFTLVIGLAPFAFALVVVTALRHRRAGAAHVSVPRK